MTRHCPTCTCDQHAERAALVERLEARCRERGHFISVDLRVSEQAAAELVGRSVVTLRHWRSEGSPLRFVPVRNRATYYLADIAEFLLANADDEK